MVEPMIERRTGDADAAIAHGGEVGQPEPARRMLLPEDDVLLGPVQRPPEPCMFGTAESFDDEADGRGWPPPAVRRTGPSEPG